MSATVLKQPVSLTQVVLPGGLAGGATGLQLTYNLSGMINGTVRGVAWQDVAGVLTVEQGFDAATFDNVFTVIQDAAQPNFRYPFSIIVIQPFVRFTFVNGGAPSTFFRADFSALPF